MKYGNQKVESGYYFNIKQGILFCDDVLPGDSNTKYYSVPVPLLFLMAPIFGLSFVLFLPFIGISMVLGLGIKQLVKSTVKFVSKISCFGWRPSESYLTGAEEEDDDDDKE